MIVININRNKETEYNLLYIAQKIVKQNAEKEKPSRIKIVFSKLSSGVKYTAKRFMN